MQRDLNYAIVDEVDSILIDEARTPLIISGQGDKSTVLYAQADRFIRTLHGGIKDENDPKDEPDDKYGDYVVFEKDKQVAFTDAGIHKCEQFFGIDNFADPENMKNISFNVPFFCLFVLFGVNAGQDCVHQSVQLFLAEFFGIAADMSPFKLSHEVNTHAQRQCDASIRL